MVLSPGVRFGPYRIVAPLGNGGMGEVFRAHDPRLGRDVAIKVLTSAVSADPERLRRFEHEARAAAALNHPNILTVHEIGQDTPDPAQPTVPYVVSELLEGGTLRDVLAGGALPLRKALDYAVQIANGLAAAHAKGIVHRDLKPENLFVTRDGRVKILDFGLAKLNDEAAAVAGGAGVSMFATRNFETAAGTVLGTMGYMSPEQLRGLTVDHRSDIFSFGAVLYEMLGGRRAFQGPTAADTITAMLTSDPPELAAGNAAIPPALDQIVRHCLEKTPELRYQAARDIVFALEALSVSTATLTTPVAAVPAGRRVPRAAVYAALAAAAAAAVVFGIRRVSLRPAELATFRQLTFRHGALDNARFTPDGRGIVYTAAWEGGQPELYSVGVNESGGRSLDVKNAQLLAMSRSGELAILLAPKSVSSFLKAGALARGSSTGSAPRPEIENVTAADYMPDGSLAIIRVAPADGLCQLEYPVGTVLLRAAMLTDLRVSHNGRYLAIIEHKAAGNDRGVVVIVDTKGKRVATGPVFESHRGLAWSPSDDEVWTTSPLLDGTLHALDLEGRSRAVLTVPGRLLLRDIGADGNVLVEQGSVRYGIIVASNNGESERDLSWYDYSFLRGITPDGTQIFFDEEGSSVNGYRAFVRGVDGSPALEVGEGYALAVSPDKAWMVTQRFIGTGAELWLYPIGPGEARRLTPPGMVPVARVQFFADGRRIVFAARERVDGPVRAYVLSLGSGGPTPISGPITGGPVLFPDEQSVGVITSAGAVIVPLEGGSPVPGYRLRRGEIAREWTTDGRLYVMDRSSAGNGESIKIDKVDPRTGQRSPWRELRAPAIDGVRISQPSITPDGRTYAYGYSVTSANLVLLRTPR